VVAISISFAAFEAIKSTWPDHAEVSPPQLDEHATESGSSWIARPLTALRTPSESYSDVILRMTKG
jgi:hypothetical protein